MSTEKIGTKRTITICILTILCSAAFAIAVHAIMPADVIIEQFDSIFVKLFSFPAVAVSYFLLLYVHCTIAVRYVCRRTKLSNLQTGIRIGISFALIYLLGMQEVIVESSPFTAYGFEFIKYQFFMGAGDAIPVFVLCIIIALFTANRKNKKAVIKNIGRVDSLCVVCIIAISFLLVRAIGYETGIIHSNSDIYPVPCYVWTVLFGIMLGYLYTMLYPVLSAEGKWIHVPVRFVAIIGVNWIIFNSFIGLIMKGAMTGLLLRSGLDVIMLFVASCVIERFIIRTDISKNAISHT